MNSDLTKRLLVPLAILLCLTGCVRIDIGESKPTVGEELLSLQQARELGAITEAEFDRLRRAVLAGI